MSIKASSPTTRLAAAALLALALTAVPAPGGTEPVRVENPAEPAEGLVTAKLTELWRTGGEDDEVFFGNVGSIQAAPDGNILLLDSQLSEVHLFSPQGELLGTIGGEGDGPGEARQPGDMLIAADGTICVLQGFPGRIVKLHPDGTPAGDGRFSTGQAGEGQFSVLVRGLALPTGMLLAGIQMSFGGGALSTQTYFLAACDSNGTQRTNYLQKQYTINYADFELTEAGMDFVWTRMAAGPQGSVYCAPHRDRYEIHVFGTEAEPDLIISRAFTPAERNQRQKDNARRILEGVGANYPTPLRRTVVEDYPQVVAGLWVTADGMLWVQPSPGQVPVPDGCWAVLDVFDPEGRFVRQVALPGSYDPEQDGLTILKDGRLAVTVGALEAFLSQQAVSDETAVAEGDPLEVIFYRLES